MKIHAGRRIGAISGLGVGIALMFAFELGGVIPMFGFGVVGTIIGAMIGERMARRIDR